MTARRRPVGARDPLGVHRTVRPLPGRVLGQLPRNAREDALRYVAELTAGLEPELGPHTWDWAPVRQALVEEIHRMAPPLAHAVRATFAPCRSGQAVGVEQVADPRTGRRLAGQRVAGLWLVTARGSVPVDWQLVLAPRWRETALRERAAIPADAPAGGSVSLGLGMALGLEHHGRAPVLLDARRAHVSTVLRSLRSKRLPYLLRISDSQLVIPRRSPPRPDRGGGFVTARQAAAEAADRGGIVITSVDRARRDEPAHEVVRLDCHALPSPEAPRGQLVLLVERDPRHPARAAYWLTNLIDQSTTRLLRLARLRVGTTFATPQGVASYGDWHRHATLASVAHAATLFAAPQVPPHTAVRTARVA